MYYIILFFLKEKVFVVKRAPYLFAVACGITLLRQSISYTLLHIVYMAASRENDGKLVICYPCCQIGGTGTDFTQFCSSAWSKV